VLRFASVHRDTADRRRRKEAQVGKSEQVGAPAQVGQQESSEGTRFEVDPFDRLGSQWYECYGTRPGKYIVNYLHRESGDMEPGKSRRGIAT
jgi:hypothetical protein